MMSHKDSDWRNQVQFCNCPLM